MTDKKKTLEEIKAERHAILDKEMNVKFKSHYQVKCAWDSIKFVLDEVELRQDQTGILMETLSILAEDLDKVVLPDLPSPQLDLL